MSIQEYHSARQLAQREYRRCVSRGQYPYLQVLDEILDYASVQSEESLGLVNIPAKLLVGTKTEGRRNAFARNFMPLLEPDSEFAQKWSDLCQAHLDEGIRDPIVAYEFMNHFYVLEGNKRVSVLKYFDAPFIPGTVRRLIPPRRDTVESRVYYDFLDFYRLTRINYLWFSQPGRFKQLLLAVKGSQDPWDDRDRGEFSRVYAAFRRVFKALGGDKLSGTTADAMLACLKLHGYPLLARSGDADLRDLLGRSWSELAVQSAPQSVTLTLSPSQPAPKTFLDKLIPQKPTPLHVAFLHEKTAETSGWTQAHEQGRRALKQTLPDRVITVAYDAVTPENAAETIFRAVTAGNEVIFTTSPKLMDATLKASVDYPEVKFLNCSLYTRHPSVRTYYGRMYEAKFLAGVLAGALTKSHRLGYVADYPIYGATAGINAFALGARMVCPDAAVFLDWSSLRQSQGREIFAREGVDIISFQDLFLPRGSLQDFGLYRIEDGAPGTRLAVSRWNWGRFYELILRDILNGTWRADQERQGPKSINYWWGMSAGVIEFLPSRALPIGTQRLLTLLKDSLISGAFHPFAGKLLSQTGTVREEGRMSPREIAHMPWLAENIHGDIPTPDQLTDEARKLVAVQGLGLEEEIG